MTALLGLALLVGTQDMAEQEIILRACVEVTMPRNLWAQDAAWECNRQRVADCRLMDYLAGPYYNSVVADRLRRQFLGNWSPDNRVWLATRGQAGEKPQAFLLIGMTALVKDIAADLPAAVKNGIPKDHEPEQHLGQ